MRRAGNRRSETSCSGSQRHAGGRESKVGDIATTQKRHRHYLKLLQNVSRVKGLETLLKLLVKEAQASVRVLVKPAGY